MPKDSTRLSISGCARGRVFTVDRDPEHEIERRRRSSRQKLRLEGAEEAARRDQGHETSMVEITGLMKQSDMVQPGVGLAGGRVRVTPAMPMGRGPAV